MLLFGIPCCTLDSKDGCGICRGISFDKLGDFKKAVADFTTVIKLDPNNVNAYFNRGSAFDSLGQYDRAVSDYTKALDLDNTGTDPVGAISSTGMNACRCDCTQHYAGAY